MFRQSGAIPPVEKSRFPKRMIVFDTEAYRGEFISGVEAQSLRMGVAQFLELTPDCQVKANDWYTFNDVQGLQSFIEYHTRKDRTLYVYAHNLKYDLQLSGLYTALIGSGWSTGLFVAEDPPTFIRLKQGRKSILLVDTFNYWQYSLSKMGEQLGLPKLAIPSASAPSPEWVTYCKRDVEVLTQYLLTFMGFLVTNDLAGMGLTLASQAFRTYRHKFMTHPIILHDDREATFLEREGYCGGRVEAYYIGALNSQPYYKLDVNSMYPFVMSNRLYPFELVSYTETYPVLKLEKWLAGFYVIADVTLSTSAPAYPLKRADKLIFPVGNYRTVLHQAELLKAVQDQAISRINRIAAYKQAPIFDDYVSYFYALKQAAERDNNPVSRQQAKLFLNSLYGKFGQREVISQMVDNPGQPRFERLTGYSEALGKNVEVNYLGDRIELRYSGGESAYSFPAIAGAVTAYARMYLWELITQAGLSNVFYLDTDSLIVNQAGYDRLTPHLDPVRLGALKLEGVSAHLEIYGAKDYHFGEEIKHKGLPKSAQLVQENLWQYDQFRGFKTWLKDGLQPGVLVYKRQKTRLNSYNKGVIQPDGSVLPLRLNGG